MFSLGGFLLTRSLWAVLSRHVFFGWFSERFSPGGSIEGDLFWRRVWSAAICLWLLRTGIARDGKTNVPGLRRLKKE